MDETETTTAPSSAPEVYDPMGDQPPPAQVWIDLLNPGPEQVKEAHLACGLRIPTEEELSEIESSSRHYVENQALYLSMPLLNHADKSRPELTPVGFIVTRERLVTIRFAKLRSFDTAAEQIKATKPKSGLEAFAVVIEAVVDRKADLLEQLGAEMEDLSHEVFSAKEGKARDGGEMRKLLGRVGNMGNRASKMHGSLVTIARILPFVVDTADGRLSPELTGRLMSAKEDVHSLLGYLDNLSNKNQFLLDAALGFINIDQNDVFKILTVVSVVGVPPTLVASIYGMNFKVMPELNWAYGYPYALGLIVVVTLLPLLWFRKKGWF